MSISRSFWLTVVAILSSTVGLRAGEPPELTKARGIYDSEVKAVRDRQIERLQAIIKIYVQRGDLDSAVATRKELQALQGTASSTTAEPAPSPVGTLRIALAKSTWRWHRTADDTSLVTFLDDGTMKLPPGWGSKVFTWEVASPDTVTLTKPGVGSITLKFHKTLSSFEANDFNDGKRITGSRVTSGPPGPSKPSPSNPFGKPE